MRSMESDILVDEDLYDILCNIDDSGSISDTSNDVSSDSCSADNSCAVIKQRKSRSRYYAPKVFKDDIRWSYGRMFTHVLNSLDPYMAYCFFKAFAHPDVENCTYQCSNVFGVPPSPIRYSRGIMQFVHGWLLNSISSPDMSFQFTTPHVRNLPGGTSVITFPLVVKATFIYERLNIDLPADVSDNIGSSSALVSTKRKFDSILHRSRCPVLGKNGIRLKNYKHENKIQVDRFCSELDVNEYNYLDDLELTMSRMCPIPLEQPFSTTIVGHMTMCLDENKKIRAFNYLLKPLQ